ncbi:MAG: nucleoside recognition domain-containing protein [Alphaproteobacteria bacterium]
MNAVFVALVLVAFLFAAVRQVGWDGAGTESPMAALTAAMLDSASGAVTLAIGLVGAMALFLGLMRVAESGGLLVIIARLLRPIMVRLFPDVPAEHPAMGAMILNLSANVLGLGNAATPFGIRAMQELDRLNPAKGTATDAMVLFLAINTANVTVLPTSVIALRAAMGSADPAGIVAPTLFATIISTAVAIVAARLLRRPPGPTPDAPDREAERTGESSAGGAWNGLAEGGAENPLEPARHITLPEGGAGGYPGWAAALALAGVVGLVPLTVLFGRELSPWVIPSFMVFFLCFGIARRVRVYERFVEGAKDGFHVAVRIIPYLVAILVAVGMLRASGALEVVIGPIGAVTAPYGVPAEALLVTLLRSLSGSGAYAAVASILGNPEAGPDTYTGYLLTTIQGSTETTFYVIAVYFGAVGVRRIRHALAAGLTADVAGLLASVAACSYLFAP